MSEVLGADNILAERVRELLSEDGGNSVTAGSRNSYTSQSTRNKIFVKEVPQCERPTLQKSLFQDVSISTDMLSELSPNFKPENVSSFIGRVNLDSMNTTRSTEYGDLPGKVDIPQDIFDNIARMKVAADSLHKNREMFKHSSQTSLESVPIQGNIQYHHPSSKPSSPLLKIDRNKHAELMNYIQQNMCSVDEQTPLDKQSVLEDLTYNSFTELQPDSSNAKLSNTETSISQPTNCISKPQANDLFSQLRSVFTDSRCSFDETSDNNSIDSLAMQVRTLLEEDPDEEKNLSLALHEFENTDLWKYVCKFLPCNAENLSLHRPSVEDITSQSCNDYNHDEFVQLVPERITCDDSYPRQNDRRSDRTEDKSFDENVEKRLSYSHDSKHSASSQIQIDEEPMSHLVNCRDTALPPVPGKSAHSSPAKVLVSKCDPDKKLLDRVTSSLSKHGLSSGKSYDHRLPQPTSTDSVVVKSIGSSQVYLLLSSLYIAIAANAISFYVITMISDRFSSKNGVI